MGFRGKILLNDKKSQKKTIKQKNIKNALKKRFIAFYLLFFAFH